MYWVQRSGLFNMELSYISSVFMYISGTLSATSVSFSVTVWVSVRVCEHSINDDELAAVCTVYTVSVIKSQQCRILHRAEKKRWAFVASLVLKDGSFLLLSAQTQQQIYQERCFSGALFHRFLQIKTCWIWLETGHRQNFPKALLESKCIKALNKTFFNWVFVHQVLFSIWNSNRGCFLVKWSQDETRGEMLKAESICSRIVFQAWWIPLRLAAEFCHNAETCNGNP